MRYLNAEQAKEFFQDVISDEFGSFAMWLKESEAVMINGHIVKDWRDHSSHAVVWYDEETDSWSVTNLNPVSYWMIHDESTTVRFVDSLGYALHRCGIQ